MERGKGICIICGKQGKGIMAKKDFFISLARKLRSFSGSKGKKTMVHRHHMRKAKEKRKKFEKMLGFYRKVAIAFFVVALVGGLGFKLDLWVLFPAALGALFIATLPYVYYFPDF